MNLIKIHYTDDDCCRLSYWVRRYSVKPSKYELAANIKINDDFEQPIAIKNVFRFVLKIDDESNIRIYRNSIDPSNLKIILPKGQLVTITEDNSRIGYYPYDYALEGEPRCGNDSWYDSVLDTFKMPHLKELE